MPRIAQNSSGSGLAHRRGLVRIDSAGNDFRAIVILSAHGTAGHAAQDGDLSCVGESVGDRALKEFFHGGGKRRVGSKIIVEGGKCTEKPRYFLRPGKWRGILPCLLVLSNGEGPVKKIT